MKLGITGRERKEKLNYIVVEGRGRGGVSAM